jgi:hypothetical protein
MASIIKADTLQSTTSNVFVLNSAGTEYARFDSSGVFQLANPTIFPAGTAALPSITTAGDTNTGLYFPAADTIAFATAGTEDMRIDSVGNVMIGTTTSQTGAKLSVTGGIQGTITSGTAVASTSGTSIDFTGIPSWVKRVTLMLSGVSTSSTAHKLIQLGTSGGVVTSGYASSSTIIYGSNECVNQSFNTGFGIRSDVATEALIGTYVFMLFGSNTWVGASLLNNFATSRVWHGSGQVSLGGTLDRVRITTASSDTFDLGSINILYEG